MKQPSSIPCWGTQARDLAELARHGLRLCWILDTHVHADHETGANARFTGNLDSTRE